MPDSGCPPPIGEASRAIGGADADFDEAPYYIALGKRIQLEADPTEFVVETDEPTTPQAVRQLFLERDLQASQSKALLVEPRHWLVTISPREGTTARSVATKLRRDPRIRFAEPVYRTGVLRSRIRPINRLVVRFKETVLPDRALLRFLEDHRLEVEAHPVPERGIYPYWFRFLPRVETRALEVAARLHDDPSVLWAEVDAVGDGFVSAAPPDPYYPQQYYLRNILDSHNGVPVDINVEGVWPVTTGQGIKVGVFDSGVDILHPDLQPTGWQSYDAVNDTTQEERPCLGDATHPIVSAADTVNNGHGTAGGGIIAAKHNSVGLSGISPSVTLHIARVFCVNSGGETVFATKAKIANAFSNAAVYWGTDVINSSWGYPDTSQAIADAMNVALTQGRNGKGTVLVFASGNAPGYPPPFPSYLPNVIAVGAILRTGAHAVYSQGDGSLDLVAPSGPPSLNGHAFWGFGDVVTLDLSGPAGINDGPGASQDYTSTFTGTSAAAPQVAGVVALLLSREPNLSVSQVISRLHSKADAWPDPGGATWTGPGCNRYLCGYGKVNALRTVANGTPVDSISGPSYTQPGGYCNYQAIVQGGAAPYHYHWQVGTQTVGGDSPVLLLPVGSSSFTLKVTVTDTFSQQSIETMYVTVDWSAPPCQF